MSDMSTTRKNIAVVGSGVSGLGAAWALSQRHNVTLIERDQRFGGHARTIDVSMGERMVPVDTGFIVFNHRNYPNLTNLLARLDVETEATDMSFSVKSDRYEFAATPEALISDPRHLASRRTWAILRGINRFRREVANHEPVPNDVCDQRAKEAIGKLLHPLHPRPIGAQDAGVRKAIP